MDPTVLTIVLVVFAAAGLFIFLRTRKKSQKDDTYYSFNCPNCHRKLRYRTRQAGHSGMCPRCSTPCTFPASPKA
jgi:hypothetical protein